MTPELYDFERRRVEGARELVAQDPTTEERLNLIRVGRLERRLEDLLAIVDRLTGRETNGGTQ